MLLFTFKRRITNGKSRKPLKELCINDFTFTATHENTLSASLSAHLTSDVQLVPFSVLVSQLKIDFFRANTMHCALFSISRKKITSVVLGRVMTITNAN